MSRPRVTITLGHGGGVVQKKASVLNERNPDRENLIGWKRPARERLSNGSDNTTDYGYSDYNKRQRQSEQSWSYNNRVFRDTQVGANDLRLKLLRKKSYQNFQGPHGMQNGVRDLREKLSGRTQSQLNSRTASRHVSLASRPSSSQATTRQLPITGRPRTPDTLRQGSHGGNTHPIAAPRSTTTAAKHGAPPMPANPANPSTRRPVAVAGNHSLLAKGNASAMPMERSKSVQTVPPSSSNMHKNGCPAGTGIGEMTVAGLLHSLGLSKYSLIFQAEEVDMSVLRHMRDGDLKELGIPMGPRKKILLALLANSRHA
eukprot:TRINITY_DN4595_c0_g1_i1.p1 TRINITY_DN4595_c0_g1~~TRINITY_DN4595_c0_g1_i1.p1  ORF type:complete len:315 (-),score=58.14 TRINITY_DN4595_c0_g1_i1:474-1418(-)